MKLKKLVIAVCMCAVGMLVFTLGAGATEVTEDDWAPNETLCLVSADVDYDGEITSADARQLLRYAVELDIPSTRQARAADCDGDGEITSADARIALRVSVQLDDLPTHFSTENIILVAATCKNDGASASLCNRCGLLYNKGVVISPGHVSSGYRIITPSTCTTKGVREMHCIYCDMLMDTSELPLEAHEYIIPKADCILSTNATLVCKNCGAEKKVVLPPIGSHEYKYVVTKAVSCTENGTRVKKCVNCGLVLAGSEETIFCVGAHSSSDWIFTAYPSCTAEGRKIKTCNTCDTVLEEYIIPKNEHTPRQITVLSESTCTVKGKQTYVCVKCGNTIIEDLPLAPHTINTTVPAVTVAPTCHSTGTRTQVCLVCGTFTEVLAKTAHSYSGIWQVKLMPTCTVDGTEVLYCNNPGCNELLRTRPLKASGTHNYVETSASPATCIQTGSVTLTCSLCGDQKTETIPQLKGCVPEDYEGIFQHATATLNEIRGYYCRYCGKPIHSTAREILGTMTGN